MEGFSPRRLHWAGPAIVPANVSDEDCPMSRSASTSSQVRQAGARDGRVASVWRLAGGRAEDHARNALLDLSAPSAGIVTPAGDRLLGFDVGAGRPPVDAWVRGDDVTAIWEPGDDRGLRATGLWRSHDADAGAVSWELVASATTRLLHADATLAVTSEVAAAEVLSAVWQSGAPSSFAPGTPTDHGLVLLRRGDGTSVLLMLHPSDHQTVTVALDAGRARVSCWLFPSGVEKGVLLRSRVVAAVGPTADDLAWASRLAARFAASPAALST